MSKLIKFVKENKVVILAFVVLALSFGLLALSGKFIHFECFGKGNTYEYNLSGYQFIFGVEEGNLAKVVCSQGIALFVTLIVGLVAIFFVKLSSFVELCTGLELIAVSILFFTTEGAVRKTYPNYFASGDFKVGFVPYLLGALIIVAALLMIYESIRRMIKEVQHPAQAKTNGPTYNYLHK